jgi:hypothetical protein
MVGSLSPGPVPGGGGGWSGLKAELYGIGACGPLRGSSGP